MFCRFCGKAIQERDRFCPFCGKAAAAVTTDDGLSLLFPKNSLALWSYYLGVAALIFCPLGLVSAVLGVLGVRYARLHPEARGGFHAAAGILLGVFAIAVWGLFFWVLSKVR